MTSAHPGDIHRALAATYRIDRELGGGGMSRVYVATDLSLARQVVVKVLAPELSAGVSAARFRREIQLVASLSHPHIIPLLSAGEADGALYYVMPYVTGEPLRARMTREGPMPVADVVRILRETLDALTFAHAHGVIHRDIKPENILISAGHAVVADFGVSKALRDAGSVAGEVTSVGVALGTPAYMAPEQAAADPSTDHRADLYALGVLAYEMLTGAPPFTGTSAQVMRAHIAEPAPPLDRRRSDVPAALASLVMRALAKDPSERPQSASEMMAALDAIVTPGGSVPMPLAFSAAGGSRSRRFVSRRSAMLLGGIVAVAIAAGATWFVTRPSMMPGAQSLAVMPFTVPDGDTALVRLAQNLVTTLSANLDGVGEIRVADAAAVLSHAKARGPLLSAQHAVDIAGRLGARGALYGTLTPKGGGVVRADAALYEVGDPAKPVVRVSAEAPADSIAALSDSLTWRFLREVWLSGRAPTAYASSIDTRSPVALREFLDGERMFAQQQQEVASVHYLRAIEADTTFWFAHYRYWLSSLWYFPQSDTAIVSRLRRHVDEIKVPERLLIRAELESKSMSDRLRELREIIVRYPTFTAAHAALADRLTHQAPLIGYGPRDAIDEWTQVAAMMPADFNAASHLITTCLTAGDTLCIRTWAARLDTLLKADPQAADARNRSLRDIANFVLADSGNRAIETLVDTYSPESVFVLTGAVYPALYARLLALRPGLAADFNRLAELGVERGRKAIPWFEFSLLQLRFERGDLDQGEKLFSGLERMSGFVREMILAQQKRTSILLELQQLRPPSRATADMALRRIAPDRLPSTREAAEMRWIAAVNGMLRDDSAGMNEQLTRLRADTSSEARIAARSIWALHAGRTGNTAVAAESLLMLERTHGDSRPKVWAAFGADRLLGARWLSENGRHAEADSLLRFTQAEVNTDPALVASVMVGAALLQRARIAEGLGERDRAAELARSFLLAYDLPSPAAKPWVDEAHDIVKRLGGPTDLPRSRETPVRPPRR